MPGTEGLDEGGELVNRSGEPSKVKLVLEDPVARVAPERGTLEPVNLVRKVSPPRMAEKPMARCPGSSPAATPASVPPEPQGQQMMSKSASISPRISAQPQAPCPLLPPSGTA